MCSTEAAIWVYINMEEQIVDVVKSMYTGATTVINNNSCRSCVPLITIIIKGTKFMLRNSMYTIHT